MNANINLTGYSWLLATIVIAPFIPHKRLRELSAAILIFFLIKWITNYKKCTISYLECKLRGVKKEQGYIYQFLDPIINLNTSLYRYHLYVLTGYLIAVTLYN